MGNERNISLSVALIAHNEGPILGDALWSVCWADQLVVVDAGSTDNTAVTAKAYGAEVYTEPNRTNLNENKNIAIDHCRGEWILVLDADEVIPYDLAGAIRRTIADKVPENGLLIPRKNFVLGRWTRRGSQYPDYQLRLFRRGRGRFPAQHVHERLKVQGKIGKLDIPFEHHPYRDLDILIEKNRRYVEFEAQHLFKNGKRATVWGLARQMVLNAPARFIRRYIFKGGFLDGAPGLMMAWFDVSNHVQRWFRLWELQR